MKVVQLHPCGDVALALRNIADQIDTGEIEATEATIITGLDVFHCGEIDDGRSLENSVLNMTMGIHILMSSLLD